MKNSNKDNKELIKQYQLIKEAFEPDSSPESNVSGPAKQFVTMLNDTWDDVWAKRPDSIYDRLDDGRDHLLDIFNLLKGSISKEFKKHAENAISMYEYVRQGDPLADMPPWPQEEALDYATDIAMDDFAYPLFWFEKNLRELLNYVETFHKITEQEGRFLDREKIKKILLQTERN